MSYVNCMKKLISKILSFFARKTIERHQPVVIGITGSMGKTGARTAMSHILGKYFYVFGGIKNYNNEIGYPLSILGINSAGKNIFAWVAILIKAFNTAYFSKEYPEVLILEMGAAKKGDIDYLGGIANLDVAVLTSIGVSHLEKFGSVKQIEKEKLSILKHIKKGGKAVYNFDDEQIRSAIKEMRINSISYGFSEGADIMVSSGDDIILHFDEGVFSGSSFRIDVSGSFMPVRLNNVISKAQAYSCLAAIAICRFFEISLIEAAEALKTIKFSPGRTNLLDGVKNTLIIDDTYNSAPDSALLALNTMKSFSNKRKIAVLGDMLELGSACEQGHKDIGREAAKIADLLFLVGDKVIFAQEEAEKSGMAKSKIKKFADSDEAKKEIELAMKEGDLVLVKGSQGMRMEKIVEEIMAEPNKAEELLVRQGKEWKNGN